MKYFATVNDQTYEIDIDHHGRVTVDGVEMAADLKLVEGKASTRCCSTTFRMTSCSIPTPKGATCTI